MLRGERFVHGRGPGMKHRRRWRRGPREHAVEPERVDGDVHIQGTSEALDHGDRAALGFSALRGTGQAPL